MICMGFSLQGSASEDSASQAASVVSEVSDEAAPILGRRAERERGSHRGSDTSATPSRLTDSHSEQSEDSDSDWDLQQVCGDYSSDSMKIARCPLINVFNGRFIIKYIFVISFCL
jgi:hypothetical protein